MTGQKASVTAIACFADFFISCHSNGTVCHYELPYGRLLKQISDHNYVHTNATAVGLDQVICSGYYQDIVVLDAYCLNITIVLLSREQGDWVSCFRCLDAENGIQVKGITSSGFLKSWSLGDAENGICLESSLGPMGVLHSKAMAFHMTRRWLLLVTTSQVLVFDVGIHLIFKHTAVEALEGGDFYQDRILFWTKTGDVYECDVKAKTTVKRFSLDCRELHVTGNRLIVKNDQHYFIGADIKGSLSVLRLTNSEKGTGVGSFVTSNATQITSNGLFDDYGAVTSSMHIAGLNKLIAGCDDGKLLIFPATDLIVSYFFNQRKPDFVHLSAHKAAIRCINHPNTEHTRYKERILVTGSDDFTVCVWDIFKNKLLHQFCVHSGPVLRLLTPPTGCGNLHTICSVAADHSVAILNLHERRCTFLASHHPFPVVAVRWKQNHNILLVKCFDGTVFVWELKTGVLDRIVCGLAAEEVVYDCDQPDEDMLWDFYTNPLTDEIPRQPLHVALTREPSPVVIYGFLSSLHSEAFLVLINVTLLTMNLKSIFPDSVIGPEKEIRKLSTVSGTRLIPYAHLALSLIHAWGQSPEMDAICRDKLGLIQPEWNYCFDQVSNQSFSLHHPSNSDRQRTLWDLIALTALTQVLGKYSFSPQTSQTDPIIWQQFLTFFNSQIVHNSPTVYEKLAQLWQTRSYAVRNPVRNILSERLTDLSGNLLLKWSKFLPISSGNASLRAIAFVLCSILTIKNQKKSELGKLLRRLLTNPGSETGLIATAIDFLGRGFTMWEPDFPLDEALVAVYERCAEFEDQDVSLTSRAALKAIAKTRLDQLIAHLKFLAKTAHPVFELSKREIFALIRELLVESPTGLVKLLSDVVEVLLACIDPSRLKETELTALLRVWLPQLHHHVLGQRVAVGMPDGKVVMHDLRARKAHIFPAHDGPIQAVHFSPDGKILMALSLSGVGSLWQLTHGLFDLGVGQFRFRNISTFSAALPPLAGVKAVIVEWRDQKTITIEAVNVKENEPSTLLTINI